IKKPFIIDLSFNLGEKTILTFLIKTIMIGGIQMKKRWKLYLIQHSHTDIGYTDRQEKIERYHVDYIKHVFDMLDAIENGEKEEWVGYKWTCENFWQVERFLENCDDTYKEKFEKYVRAGAIDISLTYLNMTELVDNDM